MRYGGVEGAKRRRLVVVEESTSAATNSTVIENVSEKEINEVSVFDLDLLDCTICTETLASPIYQCQNGHVACASCSKLTKNVCPSCKQPNGTIRCLALEKLIESLKVKCKYAELGCSEMVKFSEKRYHERICSFEHLSCPFPECNFHGKYEHLKDHGYGMHPDNCGLLFPQIEFSFLMKPTDRYYLLFEKDIYFVVNRRKSSLGDLCYLTVPKVLAVCWSKETSFSYKMEIRTLSSVDGGFSSSFKVDARCCIDESKAIPSDGFIVVPEDRSLQISVLFISPKFTVGWQE